MDQQNRKNRRITQDDYFKLRCFVVRCAKDAGVEIVNRTPGNPQGKTAPAVIVKRVEQLETMVAVLEKEVAELKG